MMIQRLASIKFTFLSLALLIFLMTTGIALTIFPEYKDAVKAMNERIIYQWLIENWRQKAVLTAWFLLLVLSAGVLFVNTVCCILSTQLLAAMRIGNLRRWLFLIIHVTFLLVLAIHGITLITGDKQENVLLCQGQSYVFGENFRIELSEVIFSDNPDLLKNKRKDRLHRMTRENFHRKQNIASISLFKENRHVKHQKVYLLEPLKYRSLRVTLTRFSVVNIDGREQIAVNLAVTRNIFTGFFFTVYAVMIIALFCFIALTWTPEKRSR